MKKSILLFTALISLTVSAQTDNNYSFELVEDGFPVAWNVFGNGDHEVSLDTITAYDGSHSVLISGNSESETFKAIGFDIPAAYGGRKIRLTGFVKTENVYQHAGLWMRIDPQVAFDNMQNRPITGTTDWNKYEITLDLKPNEAQKIVIGGLLVGPGKMWIDNLELTIDGKSLENAPAKELDKAQKDQEFDEGSGITLGNLNELQIENATILGKVWGFLKYHHPQIASGNYNWDYELFRHMTPIIFSHSVAERDDRILSWIESYGELAPCKKCEATNPDAELKPDHRWMQSEHITQTLQKELQHIYENRHQGEQYYIGYASKQVGNPEFKNEKPYAEMVFPDAGFRLLALYKLWNMVHYFSPNRHITDTDWNEVLKLYVPKFIQAGNELEYEIAALRLIGEMKDTHSNLWGGADKLRASRGKLYPPVHVQFIEDELVVTDLYNPEMKATLAIGIGDVITTINGQDVSEIVVEQLPFYPASNRAAQLRDLSGNILRSNESTVLLTIQNGTEKTVTLPLFERDSLDIYNWYRKPAGTSYSMLPGNIGYVTLANITDEDPADIVSEFSNANGLIFDIRNYPTAFMPFALGQFIAPKGTEFVKFTTMNPNNPGEFNFGTTLTIGAGSLAKKKFKGPVVVLVNELSQSQAEYTAMAFRAAPNATVVGSTTAGADGNISPILLPGGLRTMISGIGVYYPDGTPTQRVGIVPDVEVKPTIEGIREGRDELLEKAIEIIENKR